MQRAQARIEAAIAYIWQHELEALSHIGSKGIRALNSSYLSSCSFKYESISCGFSRMNVMAP